MKGWLTKQGGSKGGTRNWKKRWFVLSDTTLTYYANKSGGKPKGYMEIADCEVHPSSLKPYCFSIRTVQRELIVFATCQDEMDSWLHALGPLGARMTAMPSLDSLPAASTVFGGSTVLPEVEGAGEDSGLVRMSGTSMFWSVKEAKAVFLPTLWSLKHVRAVRSPDYLDCSNHPDVIATMRAHGDTKILFSDFIIKINRDKKAQRRVILITNNAVYTLHDESFLSRRRIKLEDLGGVSYSSLGDEFLVLHVPSQYDYLMSSTRKLELVKHVSKAYQMNFQRSLPSRVFGGQQPGFEGWRWTQQVWETQSKFPSSSIVAGTPSAATPITSPSLRLAEQQLVDMMNSEVHPLGGVVRDFIRRFQTQYENPPKSDAVQTLTSAVEGLKTFFEHVEHDLSRCLSAMACKATAADARSALYNCTFPAIHRTLIQLYRNVNVENNRELLEKMKELRADPVGLMQFLSIAPHLFLTPEPLRKSEIVADRPSERMSVSFRVDGPSDASVVVASYSLEKPAEATEDNGSSSSSQLASKIVDSIIDSATGGDGNEKETEKNEEMEKEGGGEGFPLPNEENKSKGNDNNESSQKNDHNEGGGGERVSGTHREVLRKLSVAATSAVSDVVSDSNRPYAAASVVLNNLVDKQTPTEKATCLEQTVRAIFGCVDVFYAGKQNKPIIGADDMLPLIVYVIVFSDLTDILSEAQFLAEFINSEQHGGEAVYCVRTFEIAVSFLETLDVGVMKLGN